MINNKGSITLFWIMIIIMGLLYNFIMLNIPPENSVKGGKRIIVITRGVG
jgi:hypothetical protein